MQTLRLTEHVEIASFLDLSHIIDGHTLVVALVIPVERPEVYDTLVRVHLDAVCVSYRVVIAILCTTTHS